MTLYCRYFTSTKKQQKSSTEYDESISDCESESSASEDKQMDHFLKIRNRINTNFSNVEWDIPRTPYDFIKQYELMYLTQKPKESSTNALNNCECATCIKCGGRGGKTNKFSVKDFVKCGAQGYVGHSDKNLEDESVQPSPIWCLDYLENLIVVGCANGRIEFWEGTLGKLKVIKS